MASTTTDDYDLPTGLQMTDTVFRISDVSFINVVASAYDAYDATPITRPLA
jgi:hypothetical protein